MTDGHNVYGGSSENITLLLVKQTCPAQTYVPFQYVRYDGLLLYT